MRPSTTSSPYPPLLDHVLYLCQQAAEKALKAFLYWHQQPFRRTHSLEELGAACLQLDASLGPLVDRVDSLTEYAWRTRYLGDEEEPAAEEVAAALALAREVYTAILDRLPPEVRP